jgi:hypothetical protein
MRTIPTDIASLTNEFKSVLATAPGYTRWLIERIPTAGYVVSRLGGTTLTDGYSHGELYAALEHACNLAQRYEGISSIGAWKDEELTYIDSNHHFKSRERAVEFATLHNQLAIYDVANDCCIERADY